MQEPVGLLAAALEYASRGWPVLPLKPRDKKPLTKSGHRDATTDAEQISAWWDKWPDANVGVVTGTRSGILVLDVDGPAGDEALVELGVAVPTLTGVTARGRHLYFVHPPGIGCRVELRRGLDVRGDGGYVVAPPSVHRSGFVYRWDDEHFMGLDINPAPLPESLHQILLENHRPPKASVEGGALFEGQRNVGLTEFAGSIAARARDVNEVLEQLLAANQERCRPPLPQTEVTAIAKGIWRREYRSPQGDSRPRQTLSLRRPDVISTIRWKSLHLLEPKDFAALGYLLDLARLIQANHEMSIKTGRGNHRPAWVGAGTAEIATRYLCNRWGLTPKRVRTLLERWQELGLIQLLKPRAGRKQRQVHLVEGWVKIDPMGADLFEPHKANLRHQLSACDKSRMADDLCDGRDNLSRGNGAASTNKWGEGEGGDGEGDGQGEEGTGRGDRAEEIRPDHSEWLTAGPFEVLVGRS